ncbi:MAG: hypothetical protein R3D57_14930 [Hyphomicrobiaceae bacterium]
MARTFLIVAALFTLALSAAPVGAASILEGTWSGTGYVQPRDGQRERVTCKVVYRQLNPTVHSVKATCATASMKIIQTGELSTVREGRYIGDLANLQYKIFGRVRVIVQGNNQNVTFTSEAGEGTLALKRR